jgi:hypothetical protein
MANEFQLHHQSVAAGQTEALVPDDTNTIPNTAEAVVHAIYLTNASTDTDTTVTLSLTDGSNNVLTKLLNSTELPRASTISLEKPINLPQSATAGSARKLRVTSGGQIIHATASVLVIT